MKDQILAKLQKKLFSQEECNFPCKIIKPQLRCKRGKGTLIVNFDIQLDQTVISTSKFCNDTCMKCQMEERLQKMISVLRTLTDNNKLNLSVYDQTFTVIKKSLRIIKESDNCHREKTKRKLRRIGKLSEDISRMTLQAHFQTFQIVLRQLSKTDGSRLHIKNYFMFYN